MPTPADLLQPQLFLDDHLIADSARLQRVWHAARKHPDPVLTAEHPWEAHCPVAYGTVLQRQGRYQMWYCGWTRNTPPRVCYADSDDGIRWHKPELGLFEVCGTRANNVTLQAEDPSCLIDDVTVIADESDSEWPLKMLYWENTRGINTADTRAIHLARSVNGREWERCGPVLPGWGDRFNALSGTVDGQYLLLGRAPEEGGVTGKGRVVWRSVSPDLRTWSEPELVFTADKEDPANLEVYSVSPFNYGDLLMGGIERMYRSPDVLDTELMWSRDAGRTWTRSRTRPSFIPWGPAPRWDDTWINLPANDPIVNGDQLWFYYSGRSGAHCVPEPSNHGAIGLATLRRDGFCSLQAMEQEGWLITEPIAWPGGDLALNVDCRRDIAGHPHNILTGAADVEVLTADGQPHVAFAESANCRANATRAIVRWPDDHSLDTIAGEHVRLRIRLRDAHLYAFCAVE
jgi:hypothetical protein